MKYQKEKKFELNVIWIFQWEIVIRLRYSTSFCTMRTLTVIWFVAVNFLSHYGYLVLQTNGMKKSNIKENSLFVGNKRIKMVHPVYGYARKKVYVRRLKAKNSTVSTKY